MLKLIKNVELQIYLRAFNLENFIFFGKMSVQYIKLYCTEHGQKLTRGYDG